MKPYVLSRNNAFSVSSPLLGGEEDEWGESGEKKDKEEEVSEESKTTEDENDSVKHPESKKEEESKSIEEIPKTPEDLKKTEEAKDTSKKDGKDEEKVESKIRVVASLATDPAVRSSDHGKSGDTGRINSPLATSGSPVTSPSMPTPLPSPLPPPKAPADAKDALDYVSSLPPALQTAIAAGRFLCLPPVDATRSKAPELPDNRPGLGYLCTPCGIRFSSASTLEAHQTYYCSHRQTRSDNARNSGGDSEGEEVTAVTVDTKSDDIKSVNSDQGDPAAKALRTGKQYKCPHCSYSADKKVSLNRHMRMHSSSPVDECSSSAAPLVDRYCQDCDIRFSSLKTFRAHKTHYCGTRHGSGSIPSKPQTRTPSPPQTAPPKPFLVLPTSPVLIVPYALVQSASLISGPAAANITTTDTASVLLPDGSLQPLPLAIASQPTSSDKAAPNITFSSPENKISKPSIENPRKIIDGREVSSPLDLSYRRSMEREMVIDLEDKENRRTVQNRSRSPLSPEHEDIICAPSIPLILSTSSTCSSPSPSPLSPALSSSSHSSKKIDGRKMRNDSVCNSPSPKSSAVSPSSKSPRSTPNGVVPKPGRIEDKKKSDSPLKPDPSISLQNLLLAAVAQSQMDISKGEYPRLPIPPELVPHLLGRLPEGKPTLGLPLRPGDPALLPYLAPELALNLPPPPPPPPHVLVKQGESKCNECNIVFYRIENYVAHKMYYCGANSANKISEEKPSSPPLTTSPKELSKDPTPSTSKLPVYQFICAACGIKFTSYDNLTAHQTYYCPKRTNVEHDKLRRCPKCKALAGADHQCAGGSTSLGVGWKCPCCPVTSATASQAQKHMETHSGVKAFLCTICRYKGNTLRGMRTHIRMHFDKKPSDINEESYISCIIEEPGPTKMEIDDKREDSPTREPINGGEPVRVKEEEPDPISHSQLPVKPEESEEHIDVDSVKPEIIDEPPDQIPDDLSINNNRKISPRYCKSCDISFNYLSTFLAHKRFYCPSHIFENSDNNNSSRHTGTPVS